MMNPEMMKLAMEQMVSINNRHNSWKHPVGDTTHVTRGAPVLGTLHPLPHFPTLPFHSCTPAPRTINPPTTTSLS